jgi:hypothetical protein
MRGVVGRRLDDVVSVTDFAVAELVEHGKDAATQLRQVSQFEELVFEENGVVGVRRR